MKINMFSGAFAAMCEQVHTSLYIKTCTYRSVHTDLYARAHMYESVHTNLYLQTCTYESVHTNLHLDGRRSTADFHHQCYFGHHKPRRQQRCQGLAGDSKSSTRRLIHKLLGKNREKHILADVRESWRAVRETYKNKSCTSPLFV